MKTYKQFVEGCGCTAAASYKKKKKISEAAALAIPAAVKMAPYVIPAAGAAANIFKGMMQSDASDKFKARQRPGRMPAGEVQRRQAREDRKAEARRRARENTSMDKPTVENVPTAKKAEKEKVDSRLERAAGQILDRLKNEEVQSESMLPKPSMARMKVINPPIQQEQDKEDKVKTQYDKKFKSYDTKFKNLKKDLKKLSVSEESDGRVDRAYAIDGHGNKYRDYNNDGVSDRQRRIKDFAAKRLRMLRGV